MIPNGVAVDNNVPPHQQPPQNQSVAPNQSIPPNQQQQCNQSQQPQQSNPDGQENKNDSTSNANPGNKEGSGEMMMALNPETGERTMVPVPKSENEKEIKKEVTSEEVKKKENDDKENSTMPRIVFTGFVESKVQELMKIAKELGGHVLSSQEARQVTHVVMPKLKRTVNLMCVLPFVKFILSEDWVLESKKEGKFLGELF